MDASVNNVAPSHDRRPGWTAHWLDVCNAQASVSLQSMARYERLIGGIPRLTVILQSDALSGQSIQVWGVYHIGRMAVHLGVVAYVCEAVVAAVVVWYQGNSVV